MALVSLDVLLLSLSSFHSQYKLYIHKITVSTLKTITIVIIICYQITRVNTYQNTKCTLIEDYILAIVQILLWKSSLYQYGENERTGFYRTRVSWSVCYVFALLIACSLPSLTFLFKELWSAILARADLSAAEMWAALFWTGGGEARRDRNRGRLTGREGETEWGGVESLQGKWMVGMRVVAQWMSRTLGWEVLQVLCRGSRGHSGCDWHQNNISWQATLVTGRGWPSMRRPHLEYQQPSPFYGECCMIGNSFISFVFYVIESMKLCQ